MTGVLIRHRRRGGGDRRTEAEPGVTQQPERKGASGQPGVCGGVPADCRLLVSRTGREYTPAVGGHQAGGHLLRQPQETNTLDGNRGGISPRGHTSGLRPLPAESAGCSHQPRGLSGCLGACIPHMLSSAVCSQRWGWWASPAGPCVLRWLPAQRKNI